LEIGCGNGEVAACLSAMGYVVLGIDGDSRAVAQARRRGVDARCTVWPEFPGLGSFDAVVFTRSLHHLTPLEPAVMRATQVLVPGGKVIVEDFAFSDLKQQTIDWFEGIVELLDAAGAFGARGSGFGWQVLTARGEGHVRVADHDLHSASEMRQALTACCTLIADDPAPYLYRYVWPMLRGGRRREALLARVRDLESRAAASGLISPLGRRFVGVKVD
jgi:SAM-dependent methyltransferase